MIRPMLPMVFSLLAFSASAGGLPAAVPSLEPCVNAEVSRSGVFPTQEMEDQFAAYLQWTKDQGLPRLAAFESIIDGGAESGYQLPTPAMAQQFSAYMRWVTSEGLSPFYAFMATAPRLSEVRVDSETDAGRLVHNR